MSLKSIRRMLGWVLVAMLLGLQVRSAVQADVLQAATMGPKVRVERTFFGMHAHRLEGLDEPPRVRPSPWKEGDVGGMRLWDAYVNWFDVNKKPGQFEFARVDEYMAHAAKHRVFTIYPLGMTPTWASKRPAEPCPYGSGCAAEPRDLEDWRTYVRAVLARYRGQLWMVEIWNEPYFSNFKDDRGHRGAFFSGDVATMVAMTKVVRESVNELSPSTRVCSPSFVGHRRRLDLFLEQGGGKYIDALCYHFYAKDTLTLAVNIIDVRASLVRAGLAGLPILNTESGVSVEPAAGDAQEMALPDGVLKRHAAARMAQQAVFTAMAGMDAHFYYAWDDEKLGFYESGGGPRPGFHAWGVVKKWLTDVLPGGCRESAIYRRVVICRAERGGVQQAWIWNDVANRRSVSLRTLRRELRLEHGFETIQPLFEDEMPTLRHGLETGEIQLGLEPIALTFRK